MYPPSSLYGPSGPFRDSPPVGANPWIELYQLAERAGVSVEHLCTTVEIASLYADEGKSASAPFTVSFYGDDLEEVARILADDEFEFKAKEWSESEHPRDDWGRFTDGTTSYPLLRFEDHLTRDEFENSKKELEAINLALEGIYGRKSTWSRKLRLQHMYTLQAGGRKEPECPITIASEYVRYPVPHLRCSTMIHEVHHALFPCTPEEYRNATGWEEAVIEACTRRHRSALAQQLGWNVTDDDFARRDKQHPYTKLVKELENMRKKLHYDEDSFYAELLKVPPTERKRFIQNAGASLTGNNAKDFHAAFVHGSRILDTYSHPVHTRDTKAQTLLMDREDVIAIIYNAKTPEAVTRARRVRNEWLKEHPNDWGMWELSGMLERIADGLGMKREFENAHFIDESSFGDPEI